MADPQPEQPACPVDPNARSAWLANKALSASCDSSQIDQTLPPNHPPNAGNAGLAKDREVSSIPRASLEASNSEHDGASSRAKSGGGGDSSSGKLGNWIYPSEEMFFKAMKRKSWDPKAEDMKTIVPIHNAVNERAWGEIKDWEVGMGAEKCGGPKLVSFSGDSQKLTPKARIMVLLGYQAPFDRHDWTIDRCGKKVDYVIDFYSGKRDPERPETVSFYLDVRPKLSPEGAWMRVSRWAGSFF